MEQKVSYLACGIIFLLQDLISKVKYSYEIMEHY
jgi:hypothetical protein